MPPATSCWAWSKTIASGIATVRVAEYKDGEGGDTWSFDLRPKEIGVARDGTPISSCTVNVLYRAGAQEPGRQCAVSG